MPTSTTSGAFNWTYTRDQIVKRALRQVGAIEAGETPDAQTITDAVDALNALVKGWMAIGIHVWTESEAILFLQPNQYLYQLGGATPDHCTDWQSWTGTSLAATAAAGANTVTLASATGLASGEQISVQLDSGSLFWTTIDGAPVGSTVTLAAALSGQASAAEPVYAYQTNIIRPLRIMGARRYAFGADGEAPLETPMIPMSRQDYMDLPNKSSPTGTGTTTPTQYFYAPQIATSWNSKGTQNGPGTMAIWPPPTDESSAVRFTWMRPIQDFVNAGDIPDLPVEWTNALVWNLALEMGPEYDVPPQRFQIIGSRAQYWLDLVSGWDREPESVMFGVARDPSAR